MDTHSFYTLYYHFFVPSLVALNSLSFSPHSPYNATQRLWCYGVNVDHRDHFDHANSKIQLPKNSGVLAPPPNNHDEAGDRGELSNLMLTF